MPKVDLTIPFSFPITSVLDLCPKDYISKACGALTLGIALALGGLHKSIVGVA